MDQETAHEYWDVFVTYVGAVMDPNQDQQKFYDNITEDERVAVAAMAANAGLVKEAKSELAAPPPAPTLAEAPDTAADEDAGEGSEAAEPTLGEPEDDTEEGGHEELEDDDIIPKLPEKLVGANASNIGFDQLENVIHEMAFGLAAVIGCDATEQQINAAAMKCTSSAINGEWELDNNGVIVFLARGLNCLDELKEITNDDPVSQLQAELGQRIAEDVYTIAVHAVLAGMSPKAAADKALNEEWGDPFDGVKDGNMGNYFREAADNGDLDEETTAHINESDE